MNQYFACVSCGAENEIDIDLSAGDTQRLTQPCEDCGHINIISARFNYTVNEFELEVSTEDDG